MIIDTANEIVEAAIDRDEKKVRRLISETTTVERRYILSGIDIIHEEILRRETGETTWGLRDGKAIGTKRRNKTA